MIYLVSKQTELFNSNIYTICNVEESINIISTCKCIQFDTETDSLDCHIGNLLTVQFGNPEGTIQIVVDCTSINITLYKEVLETKLLIGHNLKFDLQWLYNYNIVPKEVYDTMIVEQLLYLGFPTITISKEEYVTNEYSFPYHINSDEFNNVTYTISYSLKALALKYLNVDIDKTIRGEIIWRGLDESTIKYAANDVVHLKEIVDKQLVECTNKDCLIGAKLECDFVPAIAYLEWCGIKLDTNRWLTKMNNDTEGLHLAEQALNHFVLTKDCLSKYVYYDKQGDLFSGFNTEPLVNINWSSSKQVVQIAKLLGFNTSIVDKKTGEDKDSVLEKYLKGQKGIDDEFLKLYFNYQEKSKVCSTYGNSYLNAVNPNTGRIHTTFRQLGAASGRMACGSNKPNTSLAKLKKLSPKECIYPQLQNLPADDVTRGAFVSNEGNLLVDADYSALESRLGADIYNEKAMLDEFLYGSGDMHSLCAKMVFADQLEGIEVKDIKKVRPDLRKKVKSVEFAKQFGGSAKAIAQSLGCPEEEAQAFSDAYDKGFTGVTSFGKEGSKKVRLNGYVLMCEHTGHKMYWWDHKVWLKRQSTFTPEFWEEYRLNHKGTNDKVAMMVKEHFQAASKWDRMALNSVTQGTGIIILKDAATTLFNWIINNDYFGKILICNLVHDEILAEFPKDMVDTFPKLLEEIMANSASKYCKKLPIPAEAEVDTCWKH